MDTPEDTVFFSYNFLTFVQAVRILEASGYTFIVNPATKQIATSQAAIDRLNVNGLFKEV